MTLLRIALTIVIFSFCSNAATFASILGVSTVKTIVHKVISDVTNRYRLQERPVKISEAYENQLVHEISALEAPKSDVEQRLREGFRVFLTGLVEYLRGRVGPHGPLNVVEQQGEAEQYTESLKGHCPSVLPCPIPPCCGECKNCGN